MPSNDTSTQAGTFHSPSILSIVEEEREAGNYVITIVGPTASGKSAAALEIARFLHCDILCADARTVYRSMDIGTAKPTITERAGVPHHLIDVTTPDRVFTLADYLALARPILEEALATKSPLVIAGGTGLYIDALTAQFELPTGRVSPDLERSLRERTLGSLLEELDRRNAEEGRRVDRKNRHRVERALGHLIETGHPMDGRRGGVLPGIAFIGLEVDTGTLAHRITARVEAMFADGLLDELTGLVATYGEHAPGLATIGYKEIIEARREGRGEAWMNERIAAHTRQYAKRQRTWFRRNAAIRWVNVGT